MRHALSAVSLAVLLVACGGSSTPAANGNVSAVDLSTLPVTVEGVLIVDVAEGDVDDSGFSEYNFGTLTVGEEELLIEVSGSVLRSAGIPDEGAHVRAVLGSKPEAFGAEAYEITSLSRL